MALLKNGGRRQKLRIPPAVSVYADQKRRQRRALGEKHNCGNSKRVKEAKKHRGRLKAKVVGHSRYGTAESLEKAR